MAVQSPSALAQSGNTEAAREAFGRGNEAYQSGDYRTAIRHFQEANEIVPNARLLLYIGQCYAALNEPLDALTYVRQYAEADPANARQVADLIANLESAVNEVFNQARAEVEAALRLALGEPPPPVEPPPDWQVVQLRVHSTPTGAEVFIDDEELGSVGRTPLTTQVFPGVHHVIVKLSGHGTHRERLVVTPHQTTVPLIEARLERLNAQVDITLNPITARATYIADDGTVVDLGQGGYRGELPAGSGRFIIQQGGQERTIERELEGIQGGGPQQITLNLDPRDDVEEAPEELGTLTVQSNLAFATVSVDGEEVGTGIGEFQVRLTPGPHTIRVTQEGYVTEADLVRMGSGEALTWRAPSRLEPVGSTPWGGIITGGLGVASVVTGVIFGISSSGAQDDFNSCQNDATCSADDARGFRDDAKGNALLADIFYGVGGALIITSIVLFVTSGPSESGSAAAASPVRFGAAPNDTGGWGFTIEFDNDVF
jgi:hypothetical protein